MEKSYRSHLHSSEYNHRMYVKASPLAYLFHEQGDVASLVGIVAFFQNCVC
jgi:hypothetical protein